MSPRQWENVACADEKVSLNSLLNKKTFAQIPTLTGSEPVMSNRNDLSGIRPSHSEQVLEFNRQIMTALQ